MAIPTTRSSRQEGSTSSCCAAVTTAGDDEPDELLLDVNELADDADYVDLGLWDVSPGRSAAGLVGRLRRRRGLRAALPRPVVGSGPERRGAADRARGCLVGGLVVLLLPRPRRAVAAAPGLAAPARDARLRRRAGAGGAGRPVRARGAGDAAPATWWSIWSENRDTSEVWVARRRGPDLGAPLSVGGRRRGVEYHAEHVRHADGSDELLLVTNDEATEFRLARCPVPRAGDQDSSAWPPVRPEDPAERLEQVDAYVGHVVLTSRVGGRNQLRILPLDDLAGEGIVVRPGLGDRVPVGARRAERRARRGPDHRRGRVLPDAAGLVRPRPRHRGAHRAAPQGGARLRLRGVRRRAAVLPVRRRHPGPGHHPAPRRHAAGRLGAVRAVRLRRLRVGLPRPGVGPGDPEPARPRRGLRARPRPRRRRGWPALVAGRPDGAQAAHLRRPHRGGRRPRRGRPGRRLPDRAPAG